jgi:hypothetical protein
MKRKSKIHYLHLLLPLIYIYGCGDHKMNNSNLEQKSKAIKISWISALKGNFSFTQQWSYPEGIYKSEMGEVKCDGFCPESINKMMDENGAILKDSITAYYKLIDTSHIQSSIQCDAWCYEYAGTNTVNVIKNKDTIECYTQQNVATHCSLKLQIINNNCVPTIELTSIAPNGNKIYTCKGGEIKIDNTAFQKDTLKATFDFTFDHPENPKQPMYWKGMILQKINKTY